VGRFLDTLSVQPLKRLQHGVATLCFEETESVAQVLAVLDSLTVELERSLRRPDPSAAVGELAEGLSSSLGLQVRVALHPNGDAEVEVPVREIGRRLVDSSMLMPLADHVDEAMIPLVRTVIRVRGFVAALVHEGEQAEARHAERDALGEELQAQIDGLDRRARLWVDGLKAGLADAVTVWISRKRLPPRSWRWSLRLARARARGRAFGYYRALEGALGTVETELDLRLVESRILDAVELHLARPARRISSELVEGVRVAVGLVRAAGDRVERAHESTEGLSCASVVSTQRESLHTRIAEVCVPRVKEIGDGLAAAGAVEGLRTALDDIARNLADRQPILSPAALDRLADGVLPEEIPDVTVRATGQSVLVAAVSWHVAEARERLMALLQRAHDTLRQADRIVAYNLDSAAGELERSGCDEAVRRAALDVAGGALVRASDLLSSLPDELRQEAESVVGELEDALAETMSDLRQTILGARHGSVAALARSRQIERAMEAGEDRLRTMAARFDEKMQRLVAREKVAVRRVLGRLGRAAKKPAPHGVADPEEVALAREASLPHAYQMLFADDPVPSADLLVGRDDALARIAAAVRRVRAGYPASAVIVGPHGAGRSSLLRVARENVLEGVTTHLLDLDPGTDEAALASSLGRRLGVRSPHGLGDLIAPLSRRDAPVAVLIDDLGSLFTRAPGGLSVLEALGRLITATSSRVLWVSAAAEPLWRFLGTIGRVPHAFTEVVDLQPLTPRDIARMIMVRHALSGYRLDLSHLPLGMRRGPLLGGTARWEATAERSPFFKVLWKVCSGNPQLALLIWRRALEPTADGRLRLFVPERPVVVPIFEEDLDALATLATIILQGSLDSSEHAECFGWEAEKSERMLLAMQQRGWLTSRGRTGDPMAVRYCVVPAMSLSVEAFLRARGMLP